MAETEKIKRQQIILLHGDKAFDKAAATNLELVKGELVVEHGSTTDKVKLHTLDNAGNVATFITESAITKTTNAISTRIDNLDAALSGYTNANAVQAKFEAVEGLISGNSADIKAIKEAVGLEGEVEGDTLLDRVDGLEDVIGATSDTGNTTIFGNIYQLNEKIENVSENASGYTNSRLSGLTLTSAAEDGKVVTAVTQSNGQVSVNYGSVKAQHVSLTGNSAPANVQAFYEAYSAYTYNTDVDIDNIEGDVSDVSATTENLKSVLTGFSDVNTVDKAVKAAKTSVSGETENADKDAYIHVAYSADATDGHSQYNISVKNAVSAKKFEDFKNGVDGILTGISGTVSGYVTTEIAKIVDSAPEAFDTLKEIADWITTDASGTTAADIITDVEAVKTILGGYGTGDGQTATVKTDITAVNGRVDDVNAFVKADDFITVSVDNTATNSIVVTPVVSSDGKHSFTFNFDGMVINGGTY